MKSLSLTSILTITIAIIAGVFFSGLHSPAVSHAKKITTKAKKTTTAFTCKKAQTSGKTYKWWKGKFRISGVSTKKVINITKLSYMLDSSARYGDNIYFKLIRRKTGAVVFETKLSGKSIGSWKSIPLYSWAAKTSHRAYRVIFWSTYSNWPFSDRTSMKCYKDIRL